MVLLYLWSFWLKLNSVSWIMSALVYISEQVSSNWKSSWALTKPNLEEFMRGDTASKSNFSIFLCCWVQNLVYCASGDVFSLGATVVTYTVEDNNGNSATASFTVTVEDDEAPTITGAPGDTTLSNDAGICGAVLTWTEPVDADNCEVDTVFSNSPVESTNLKINWQKCLTSSWPESPELFSTTDQKFATRTVGVKLSSQYRFVKAQIQSLKKPINR